MSWALVRPHIHDLEHIDKIRYFLAASLCLPLILSVCSGNDGSPEAGQYLQTVKITELDFPGITGDMKAQTIKQMGGAAGGGTGGRLWKQTAKQMSGALGGNCETKKDEGSATNKAACHSTLGLNGSTIVRGRALAHWPVVIL